VDWIGWRQRVGDTRVGQLQDGLGAGAGRLGGDGEGAARKLASHGGERRPAERRGPVDE
jgi:hypothetical protein